ncbi:MAG: DMT family transporter [Lentisphaeria bacterium]|nr:DMT family transporter [Lentisphaeria bacterium]
MASVSNKKRVLGLLCALLATTIWAGNYPVSRLLFNGTGAENLDEWWTAFLRSSLGIFVMLPVSLCVKEGSWKDFGRQWKADWKMFVFLSGCCVAENVICFVALKYTTSARASLMANASPLFTLLISVLAAKEVFTGRKILGLLMGLAGIILTASSKGGDAFSNGLSMLLGDLLALVSGVFWAFFTVFGSNVASRYNGAFCTALYRFGGMFFMIPVLIYFKSRISFDFTPSVWCGLVYLSVVSSGLAVWLWSVAQRYVEPGVLGSFGYLGALFAAGFSLIFLKERISVGFILAFCLILGGMALVIRRKEA